MTYGVQSPDAARLWAYGPDWSAGFDVRRGFRTDITTSRNNTEQRRAIRTDPRMGVEYRTVVSGDDFRDAKHFLRAWQNKPTIVPDFARWARTTAGAILGASAIVIAPLPAWAAAGQNLLLCGEGGAIERVLVDNVAGTTINLVDPLASAWASGSVVRPTFHGLLDGKITGSRRNRAAAEISVRLDSYPGGEPPRTAGAAWATLNAREIFTLLPDYLGAPSVSSLWPVEEIDYGRGRTAQFRPFDLGQGLVEADFKGLNVALAGECEQFFDRMKGRRGAFYLPTWEKDFELAATAGSGTATMLASGTDLVADFGSTDYADVEEALAVWLIDGTTIYRRITDISASGGNSQITVDSNWGTALTIATVARISRMPLVRFGSDEMTTSWRTPLNADARLSFQSVRA
jgi:hypothetical protein